MLIHVVNSLDSLKTAVLTSNKQIMSFSGLKTRSNEQVDFNIVNSLTQSSKINAFMCTITSTKRQSVTMILIIAVV